MLIGNLTRDPEIKYTSKGMAVAEISLAVNRRYTVEGEKREEVTFVEVTFWGKKAEVIGQYCRKGNPIYVDGRLKQESWDDKETGKKRSKMTVTGEEFQFLTSKEDGNQSRQPVADQMNNQARDAQQQSRPKHYRDGEESIPF